MPTCSRLIRVPLSALRLCANARCPATTPWQVLYEESKGDAIITTGVGQHQMWAAQVRRLALGLGCATADSALHDWAGRVAEQHQMWAAQVRRLALRLGCATADSALHDWAGQVAGQHQMWAAQVHRLALGVPARFCARWLGGAGCRAACWLHAGCQLSHCP